jgi:hypothetical protein
MIDRRTIALINGEVDGVNTPGESEILRQTLARNAEAQKLLEDLRKLERNFSSISPVEPPASLKKGIMRSIEERRGPAKAHTRTFRLLDVLFPASPLPRLGFAFGGGVLAGIVLVILYFTVVSHPPIDSRDASGTLLGASSESLQMADDEAVTHDGVQGRVVTEYSSTLSVLRVDLTMPADATARFLFSPDGARLKGVVLGEGFSGSLTQSNSVLEMGHGGGAFRAFFVPGASSTEQVQLQIVSSGKVVYERSFPLAKAR